MKHISAAAVALSLAIAPAHAQSTDAEDGFNLMEEGAKLLLRGLMEEMEPNIDEFRDLIEEFGPSIEMMITELGPRIELMLDLADDFQYYGNPEILPNGDIIIRRLADAPPYQAPEVAPDDDTGEVEL